MAKILVLEDEPDLAEIICLELEMAGHVNQWFSNAKLGLEHLLEFNMDLIITDIHMPVAGFAYLDLELRTRGIQIPTILMTGSWEELHSSHCFAHHPRLLKPFDFVDMLKLVEEQISKFTL